MKQVLLFKPWLFTSICLMALVPFSPIQEVFRILAEGFWYFWMFSISFLGEKYVKREGMKEKKSMLLIIAVVFIPISRAIEISCTEIRTIEKQDIPSITDTIFMIALLLSLVSTLYLIFRTARILTILELKREVLFKETIVRTLLVVGAVISIWFLQPKLKPLRLD